MNIAKRSVTPRLAGTYAARSFRVLEELGVPCAAYSAETLRAQFPELDADADHLRYDQVNGWTFVRFDQNQLAELQALAGPSYYNRIDIRFKREGYDAIKADTLTGLEHEAPEVLAGIAVARRSVNRGGTGSPGPSLA